MYTFPPEVPQSEGLPSSIFHTKKVSFLESTELRVFHIFVFFIGDFAV